MALTYDIEKDRLYQQGIAKGIEEGRKEGKEEGKTKEKYATAEKCLRRGMSIEDTAELTGLPIEEVKALARRLKK